MLITKESFIYYTTKFKEAYEEQQRFNDALRPFFERPICKYRDDLFDTYESMLVAMSECEEEDGIFSWWLFESPKDNKIITVRTPGFGDEEVFDCSSAEGLYEYLVYMYHKEK